MINGSECELLSSNLEEVVANGVRKLLFNPTNLTQVDGSGVTIIVATFVDIRSKGGDLRLLCPSGRVMEVFTLLRLLEIIPSFEDEAQALTSSGLLANTEGP
jgi:stage II sporulation protein AA (anti-sigma F factor antagonist)